MDKEILIKDPVITKQAAIKKAGNAAKLARLLGIARASVSVWGEFVPPYQAYRLAQLYPDLIQQQPGHLASVEKAND